MKKIFLTLVAIIIGGISLVHAQQSIKYQTVIRDGNGEVIPNQNVTLMISILQGTPSGTIVYAETHSVTTNDFGLVNIATGSGTVVSGNFDTIEWGADTYYLETKIDETGGTNYQILGTTQIMAVPYSFYAEKAGNVVNSDTSAIAYSVYIEHPIPF